MSDQPEAPNPVPSETETGLGGVAVFTHTGARTHVNHESVQPYHWRQPSELSGTELRRFKQRHAEFVRALAARLSIHLRIEFAMNPENVRTLSYSQLIERFRTPTHLTLFKADPLRGVGILEVPVSLSLLIVDRLLGGPGTAPGVEQELTPIEVALLEQALDIILGEWCLQWQDVQELKPVILGSENNARFLQSAPSDTTMLLMGAEVTMGSFVEHIRIAIPCATMSPVTQKLAGAAETDSCPTNSGRLPATWNACFDDLEVPVNAEWHGLHLTAREVAGLKVGNVLTLDAGCAADVLLKLAGIAKFRGTLGTCGTQWAVQLAETANR